MKIIATVLLTTLLSACNVSFHSGNESAASSVGGTAEQQAVVVNAADKFLQLVDSGKAGETWETTSPLLKAASNETVWVMGIQTFRNSVGTFKSRKLKGVGFTGKLDGAPPGAYAAIAFASTFSGATVEEKVVVQKDHGQWKVIGYFLSKTFSVGGKGDT